MCGNIILEISGNIIFSFEVPSLVAQNVIISGGLVLLWFIESNHHISICFPLMVAAIVGIRKAMDYFPNIFTQRELSWLDDVIPDEQKERFK